MTAARPGLTAGRGVQDGEQSTADLTAFVQNLLQQMVSPGPARPRSFPRAPGADALLAQQTRFQQMSDNIVGRIDEMGTRIDDLEKSIGELIQQAGIEEEETKAVAQK